MLSNVTPLAGSSDSHLRPPPVVPSASEPLAGFGRLIYLGSPTQGSVIVYSSQRRAWSRVPMQDIAPPRWLPAWSIQEWLRWFQTDRWAQALGLVLVLSVGLIAVGGYGVGQKFKPTTVQSLGLIAPEPPKNGFKPI